MRWPINRNVSSLQFNPRPKGRIEKQIEERRLSPTLSSDNHMEDVHSREGIL